MIRTLSIQLLSFRDKIYTFIKIDEIIKCVKYVFICWGYLFYLGFNDFFIFDILFVVEYRPACFSTVKFLDFRMFGFWTGMSQSLSSWFLKPSIINSLFFTTKSEFLFSSTSQLSSHSWPSEISDELWRPGRMAVVTALLEKLEWRGSWPFSLDLIFVLFGRVTVGPGEDTMFFRNVLSLSCQ